VPAAGLIAGFGAMVLAMLHAVGGKTPPSPQPNPNPVPTGGSSAPSGASMPARPMPKPQPGVKAGQPIGPDGKPIPPEDEDDVIEEPSEVAAVMGEMAPWLISLAVHAAIVILAIFIIWSAIPRLEEEEPVIPIAKLSQNPGAPLSMQTTTKLSKASSSRRTVTKSEEKVTNLTSKVPTQTQLIGVAGGTSGKASPFGTAVGSGGPFAAGFFGSGGNARQIAYIVDASGSLIDTLPFVVVELKRSISELSEQQAFTVIFFQGNEVLEAPPAGLKKATPQNKQLVIQWIDPTSGNVVPGGRGNPVPAIKQALRYKPQLLFVLSDNITGRQHYEMNQARFMDEVTKANVGGTKINTIQFLYPDPLTKYGFKGTLELLANESSGMYKFVDGRELGIQVN
jgi:hypothetical protein